MIQRIQTVWLLLAMACAVLLYYFPVWVDGLENEAGLMDSIGAGTHLLLVPWPAILFLTHAFAIWSFKKRKRQIMLCNVNVVLFILFLVFAFIFLQVEADIIELFDIREFNLGAILPLIGIIFNLMARRAIKKDEELIRSMNRLR